MSAPVGQVLVGVVLQVQRLTELEEEAGRAACLASGGLVSSRGLSPQPLCVKAYPDGGKPCTDSRECQGGCLTGRSVERYRSDSYGVGRCQFDNAAVGCLAEVKAGTLGPTVCVD